MAKRKPKIVPVSIPISISKKRNLKKIIESIDHTEIPVDIIEDVFFCLNNKEIIHYRIDHLMMIYDYPEEVEEYLHSIFEAIQDNLVEIKYNFKLELILELLEDSKTKLFKNII